ncbi:copper resistance CopC family protein [Corynebacterium halotolerans]|uniref:CopC domain-containing protein n=1 Tax=Corynebacterium halotolerans YIM 70093 = DSM 44683 TaxID=1121362 RepID=M1NYQ4_9CORY|nr:copper resistance CopC family protein [Corynebacterium halotolerans]AGF72635.1 hypothetical protein A605_08165 [Corynebacterium halotolerans YIM 70093 = DSM 44683]
MIIPRTLQRPALAALAAAGAVTIAAAPAALAHDVVVSGDPADGAVVEEFPRSIELEFSGIPREGFSTVAVTEQDSGELLYSGEPTIDGQMVTLELPEDVTGGPGEYTVGFQITSSDGHATRGMTTFTVAGDEQSPEAGAEPTNNPDNTDNTDTAATAENVDTPDTTDTTETADTAETAEDTDGGLLSGPLAWVVGAVGILAILGVIIMMIAKGRNTPQE